MLRVVFVLPSLESGGAEQVTLTLLSHLDRSRYRPELLVLDGRGPLAQEVPRDIRVHDLGIRRLRWALPKLLFVLYRQRPEIVVATLSHVNLGVIAFRSLLPNRPRIVIRESSTPSKSLMEMPWPRFYRAGYRLLYPKADAVICLSRSVAEEMTRDFHVPAARVHRLPNPVDVARLRCAAQRPVRMTGSGPRFVAAGRLVHAKGFDRLIEMFAELPQNTHLTIFGDGPERAKLELLVGRLSIADRVRLAGFSPHPWAAFAGADAFLLTSRREGMPNAALEALACGTPVIATPDAGGIVDVAAETPAGAVILAECGPPFVAAVRAVIPAPPDLPRPSLLPWRFEIANAVKEFTSVLADSTRRI